jgi:hypothetical protein
VKRAKDDGADQRGKLAARALLAAWARHARLFHALVTGA